jgi:excisionase family DNA binding protein
MLTSTKLGRALGLTKTTVNRLAKSGHIPFVRLPSGHRRFDLEEVKSALSTEATLIFAGSDETRGQKSADGDDK